MTTLLLNKRLNDQAGLTLVELMIAMVIGLVLTGGVIQIFVANNQTYRVTDNMSRMQENGRFAVENLARIIRVAGFKGETENSPGNDFAAQAYVAPNPVVTFTNTQTVSGSDGGVGGANTLDPSDDIFIRLRGSTFGNMTDCIGTNVGRGSAFAGVEIVNRYYLNGTTLTCHSSTNPVPQPLIDNVVSMQLLYGMTTDASAYHNVQAECYIPAVAANIITAPATSCANLNFAQVVSIRIKLLLSTPDDNLTPDGAAQVIAFDDLDVVNGTTDTMIDRRLYRQVSKTISLRNKIL